MGVMTRQQGAAFVISSDRSSTDAPTNRAPKGRPSFENWTGETWSAVMELTLFGYRLNRLQINFQAQS